MLDNKKYTTSLNFSSNEEFVGGLRIVISINKTSLYDCEDKIANTLSNLETFFDSKTESMKVSTRPNADDRTENCQSIDFKLRDKLSEIKIDNLGLSDKDLELLEGVLLKNKEVFSDEPGCVSGYTAKLNVKSEVPYIGKSYPVPFSKRKSVEEELEKLKEADIIEESNSPFSNPLVCVVKKDLSIRLCLDSRKLNTYLIPDRQSTETTDDILMSMTYS